MMLFVFTEEPSAKIVFDTVLPKILPEDVYFRVYPHQGKQDLENALRTTLPSISKIPNSRILVTRDQDSADCKVLKQKLIDIFDSNCSCPYKVRIVCKELESWFLGDLYAIQSAFPRFKPEHYIGKSDYRNVDRITNPNKHVLKIIPEYSDRDSLPKLETAELISKYMNIERNNSLSFKYTINGIRQLISVA